MYQCNECQRKFDSDHNKCPICIRGYLVPAKEELHHLDSLAHVVLPTKNSNYKKKRAEEKKRKADELLATAKQEVRRLEKGIDKVLYALANEDTTDAKVIESVTKKLIELYNGKEI